MNDLASHLIRTRDLRRAGLDDRALRTAAARGELHRVAVGTYVPTTTWTTLDDDQRYFMVVHARMERLDRRMIASHESAAVLWGMPKLDTWPRAVHVVDAGRGTPSTRNGVTRHPGPIGDEHVVEGRDFAATDPARTALDLALRDGFVVAVMLFDHVLRHHGVTREVLRERLALRTRPRRLRAVARAIDLASTVSDSPAESISFAQIVLLGFEVPERQREFRVGESVVAVADFWWESVRTVGEMDGDVKYTSEELRDGRTAAEVVIDEKWRSENLQDDHGVRRVVRWNYHVARNPALLDAKLRKAGIPRAR